MLSLSKPLSRNDYLQVVRTGLLARQFSFSRQALLNWLASYPGDLEAGLLYAQSLIGEHYYSQAIQVLLGLTFADPEFAEAVKVLNDLIDQIKVDCQEPESAIASLFRSTNACKENLALIEPVEGLARAHWMALNGAGFEDNQSATWGGPLYFVRQALAERNFNLAGELIQDLIAGEPAHPLIGIIHLRIIGNSDTPQDVRYATVKKYHQRWPDNLEIMLRLADWSMERAETDQAVALLHQSASRDVTGQVIRRIWGDDHPFRAMWPENLELKMTVMIPAVVAAVLGWNRLTSGTAFEIENLGSTMVSDASADQHMVKQNGLNAEKNQTQPDYDLFQTTDVQKMTLIQKPSKPAVGAEQVSDFGLAAPEKRSISAESEIRAVEREIEKLAAKYKISGLTRQDGRFPVYIILSLRGRLQSVYGTEQAQSIEREMRCLAEAICSRPGWDAKVCFADDLAWAAAFGTKPVRPDDPWGLKMVLSDLDNSLAKQGERIGALLIVGGPEIVPFHLLPNPVDDQDSEVPSDNPYATRDRNYFIPEWPVGRLPGGAGNDSCLILKTLRRFQLEHRSFQRNAPVKQRLSNWLDRGLKDFFTFERESFGYTAEIWLEAARSVFYPIGKPGWLHVSPPSGLPQKDELATKESKALTGIPIMQGKLGYFNLHGLVNSNEWYGHRDPAGNSTGPDYPVALRPDHVPHPEAKGNIPRVVFSEACYGLNIQNRGLDEAISLKFLDAGTQAIAGSTSMAYGSIDARPMMAADLLGYTFWRFLKSGLPAGEALRQAKIYLASEMKRRQGYLDGEDQKTLISFLLYGDPLAEPISRERVPGSIRYSYKQIANVKTVDKRDPSEDTGPVPPDVMDSVREVVAKYLPGMTDAHLAYIRENEAFASIDGHSNASEANNKRGKKQRSNQKGSEAPAGQPFILFRSFVTLSKKNARQGEVHPEIARLTLDEKGKLVKLVVSR